MKFKVSIAVAVVPVLAASEASSLALLPMPREVALTEGPRGVNAAPVKWLGLR